MKIGLIGLPRSGKTTLFNLLTGAKVATARYD
ncbi:MAG: 50S ribosome-binding GTPase, partial [Candidatus Rokubacteria bacterium]|nr:50S ribosome-binding GTPase [Candidatus Rokubacteria bacterium]